MFDLDKWITPHLQKASQYSMKLGEIAIERPEVARMCLNENPLPISEKVTAAILEGARQGHRYPDVRKKMRTRLAERYGLGPENVFLGNGSSEVIDNMMRAFLRPGREILLPELTFSLFNARADVEGGTIVKIKLEGPRMDYSVDNYLNAITENTALILVVTPNNPTGSVMSIDDIRRILDRGIPTCIDEAYIEFDPSHESAVPLLKEYPNAFFSRTMSKAYGMAGIRFGYMYGSAEMVSVFEKLSLPWNMSFPAVLAAEAALDDTETLQRNIEYNRRWLDRFTEEAESLGMQPIRPLGNFVLINATMKGKTNSEIFDAAIEAGVLLKTATFRGEGGYFRLTPGTEEESERAVTFMRSFFG